MKIKHDNQYLSYIIEDASRFSPTGYRVLKKQKGKGFIPCSKISYNGDIKLLYPIEKFTSVFNAADEWKTKEVIEWILRILKGLMDVRDNGFLRIDDVDLDLSRIFVEETKKEVWLVILPFSTEGANVSEVDWEITLRKNLMSIIDISRIRDPEDAMTLKQVIRDYSASLDLLYKMLKAVASTMHIEADTGRLKEQKEVQKGELHIVSRNTLKKVDIAVTKESFIIGKNPKLSDGVVDVSPTISRQHCRIMQENGEFFIEDLKSLNKTYVDGKLLEPGKTLPITKGTQIRLAEIEFTVEFRN